MRIGVLALVFGLLTLCMAQAEDIRIAVTTSFHNSGLADILIPQIRADIGLDAHLVVVGTGQALRLGQAGDVDAVLVHSRTAEDAFIAAGFGTHRREIMYNDFVIIGPNADPALVGDATTVTEALQHIFTAQSPFVSRSDQSGTHVREMTLWAQAGIAPKGAWYREAGAGMGATLNVASAMNAYTLADRASWLNFGNKSDLNMVFAGDPALFNQYAFIPVNPDRHPHIRYDLAMMFEAWLTSETAADLINSYRINGERLFTFNATAQ